MYFIERVTIQQQSSTPRLHFAFVGAVPCKVPLIPTGKTAAVETGTLAGGKGRDFCSNRRTTLLASISAGVARILNMAERTSRDCPVRC